MKFECKPLSSFMGAEIIGIDLTQNLDKDLIEDILGKFYENKILVFRDQQLNPEQQIEFCRKFGEIEMHPTMEVPWKHREITYVANVDLEGNIYETCGPTFELWHSDTCYLPNPAKMSFLYAEKVPNKHGETIFADMVKAFDELPNNIKDKIINKTAIFGSGHNLMKRCHERGYPIHIDEGDMQPDVVHPVVRTHPVTRKKSIFVNWGHTDRINDLPEDESNEVLSFIYEHSRKEDYIYTHYYREGDLIVWDNASTIHSNCVGVLTEPRIMRRVMIKGQSVV